MEGVSEGEEKKPRLPCKRDCDHSTTIKGKSPSTKKRRLTDRKTSTLRPRLGGSLSDPLNLEVWSDNNRCSTCAPERDRNLGDQSRVPLPEELHHDPLNLEEKISDFESLVGTFNHIPPASKITGGSKRRRKRRSRQKSQSDSIVTSVSELNHTSSSSSSSDKSYNPKAALYRYGNYDRYYGYRNNGSLKDDPRLKMFNKEWFKGKTCLDIGSNTGQITIEIGRLFAPTMITGIDIDAKLVRISSKNLNRSFVPSKMPDGRPVPQSLLMSFGPIDWLMKGGGVTDGQFPHNVRFIQGNYVPLSEEEVRVQPEYDVILCLSVTKWIHLNWGDAALKGVFRKMYHNLRPSGLLILEPQPWASYGRRKKLTAEIFENYQNIKFFPGQFHDYLMSSEVGFTRHKHIGVSGNSSPGFQRPIHVYFKDAPPTNDEPHPSLPAASSISSSEALADNPCL